MTLKPIILHNYNATHRSEDATIDQYTLAPAPSSIPPSYHPLSDLAQSTSLSYVPSLSYFCFKALFEGLITDSEALVDLGNARVSYRRARDRHDFDILQALFPTYRPLSPEDHCEDFNLRLLDPRAWAGLIQLIEDLPPIFREYTIPLSDVHLPLLQTIPNTPHFSLVTVLSLPQCHHLNDETIVELRALHALSAFDASGTLVSSFGIRRLTKTVVWSEEHTPERRGPWGLRALFLVNCFLIDKDVFDCLLRLPLLSIIGKCPRMFSTLLS
ncbi:uncharacterized protein BXZ73DRAFT_37462 [Epithele typhae]|uniref:uncharacterized protein n=1 Tax=Epithele typhae TaxID=378194 RepID=UPI0020085ECC|nr:uncharacterized protein BXZ73DRAFT_37462 [Epithele typhae]KAH9946147.1 hypothetical protein BXZ73DRAFT_37462 [Epithele typhae]